MAEPGFFAGLPPLPGALRHLRDWNRRGHKIYILSSPFGPHSAKEKLEWCARYMPWLSRKRIILANEKTMVKGDLIIDDKLSTLVSYVEAWPEATAWGISWPYNNPGMTHGRDGIAISPDGKVALFDGWKDPYGAWAKMGHFLEDLP